MSLPKLPPFSDIPWVNADGKLAPEAFLYSDEMSQTLIRAITLLNIVITSRIGVDPTSGTDGQVINDGLIMANKTTVEINNLEPNAALGTVWFDTTISKLKVKTASGIIETITST